MRGLLTLLVMVLMAPVAFAQTGAQTSALESLDTMDAGRQWQAVGRLDINGTGFCTGALIAPNLVLTASHCLFNKSDGSRVDPQTIEFLAGWRNGRAAAYRKVRRAVVHPDYVFNQAVSPERVRNDLALLELERPIRNTTVIPFETDPRPRKGDKVGVVSYAKGRADAPSLQQVCAVIARQQGILVMNCDVDFGSSGAPIFSFASGTPRIVSIVSAKAEISGERVALGTSLLEPLAVLQSELAAGRGFALAPSPSTTRVVVGGLRNNTGAKFVKP
jgi:protease YdgD